MPIFTAMSERGLHHIEDDLSETLLAKHAAFLSFLDAQES
jgi:hypothetical protein